MDVLKVVLYANVIAMLAVVLTGGYLAWESAQSRNLGLGIGAVVAAMMLFAIQLAFELRSSTERDHLSTEVTIDRQERTIRSPRYTMGYVGSARAVAETNASSWLASVDSGAFEKDRGKVTTDLVVFSLVGFLNGVEFDWQRSERSYGPGPVIGTVRIFRGVSEAHECASFRAEDLRARLAQVGNVFSGAQLPLESREMCLPPRSTVEISELSLVIQNPFCEVSFEVDLPVGGAFYLQPGTQERARLPNGEARFETRTVGVSVKTTYFALRSQHRDSARYRQWTSRLVRQAGEWFAVSSEAESVAR